MEEPLGNPPEPVAQEPRKVWTVFVYRPAASRWSAWQRWGRHVLLFLLTGISCYVTARFWSEETQLGSLALAFSVLAIMLAHEMGHYLACRRYGIEATLPIFLPAPVVNPLVGTFGAVIRIRSPFPNRRALFDIGIAGPLAGFVVCLPILFLGVLEARAVDHIPGGADAALGLRIPLIFHLAIAWLRDAPAGGTLQIGPFGTAAWFGLLLTGLNLIPIGQLDGGHVIYALFRGRAFHVSRLVWWGCVLLVVLEGPSWIVWAVLVRVIGFRHPRPLDDAAPLGIARVILAAVGLAVLVLCFLPSPVAFSWREFFESIREVTGR